MIGAIVGDIIGSRFEFNNRAPIGGHLVGGGATFTDETVCIVSLADAIHRGATLDHTMRSWCREFMWVSYGKMFSNWIQDSGAGPYNSIGNGCVARICVAHHFTDDEKNCVRLAKELSALTHNHPESLRVVGLLSRALFVVADSRDKKSLVSILREGGFEINVEKHRLLGTRVEFSESVTQIVEPALSAVIAGESFEDVMRICIARGGDTDSICSLAGTFAEQIFGIPDEILLPAMAKLPAKMREVLERVLDNERNIILQEGV